MPQSPGQLQDGERSGFYLVPKESSMQRCARAACWLLPRRADQTTFQSVTQRSTAFVLSAILEEGDLSFAACSSENDVIKFFEA